MTIEQGDRKNGIPAAAIAMVGWAASGVIAKGITELGALAVVFWRMWIYAVIVILFLKIRGTPLKKESFRGSWKGGVALGADIMLFFSALRLTTVANATVIGSCQPYTNSIILNNKVLVPIENNSYDDDALASYAEALPGYEILGFTGSWESTDALHCRAKGIPDLEMECIG